MSSSPKIIEQQYSSPDENAAGLTTAAVDPLRYDGHKLDPDEVSGIVASMIPAGARVLDVGCGTGSLAQILSRECRADITGIEPDPARAELAISRGLNVHIGMFSRDLIHEVGFFDIVLFADVLEHLPNPQAMLLTAREALNPGGAVIVSVPNVAHWSVREDILRGRFQYQACGIMDATHLRWFTKSSIQSLLSAAGFTTVAYRASAGLTLPDNVGRRPWRWLPPGQRAKLLRSGCRHWPTLLGCQHVIKAQKA